MRLKVDENKKKEMKLNFLLVVSMVAVIDGNDKDCSSFKRTQYFQIQDKWEIVHIIFPNEAREK